MAQHWVRGCGESNAEMLHDTIGIKKASIGPANGVPLSGRVDKTALAIAEPRRSRDSDHLRFVANQPCLICERKPAEAHHLKFAQPAAMGRKVSDAFTVPLCALHHREL